MTRMGRALLAAALTGPGHYVANVRLVGIFAAHGSAKRRILAV